MLSTLLKRNNALSLCCILTGLWGTILSAQNTNYTAPYTSGNFTKTINVGLPVGTVAATADANSGAASYTIPIAVPPGTNGAAPSVAITYNSMGNAGPLGFGWSISGLSVITRAAQTIYHNGGTKAVELNNNDRFVLDGARLFAVSGAYGGNETSYRTEAENFAIVTSHGSLGSSPEWFKVQTKDGMIMYYGNSPDSKFLNEAGTEVLYWRLNRIEYRSDGNYIDFAYNNSDRESRIDEIRYTGNIPSGLLPYNKLKFNYSVRSDVNTTYEAGTSMRSKYLVDNIVVTAENGTAFKTYTFKYAWNNVNSLLKEVIESGSNGAALNSTIFKYGDEPANMQTGLASSVSANNADVFTGDFNADGYSDILTCTRNIVNGYTYHTNFKVYKKIPSQTNHDFTLGATQTLPTNFAVVTRKGSPGSYSFFTNDFSGDGADDVATTKIIQGSNTVLGGVNIYKSENEGNSFSNPVDIALPGSHNKIHSSGKFIFAGDFNGDGISDLLSMLGHITNGTWDVHMYHGNGLAWFGALTMNGSPNFPFSMWPTADQVRVLDFNGDGRSDIMIVNDGLCEIFTFDNFTAKRIYVRTFPNDYHLMFFGDFNGDGKTDMLVRNSLNSYYAPWYKHISTGTDFIETPFSFNIPPAVNSNNYGDKLNISDFNGDGRMDIMHASNYWIDEYTYQGLVDIYYSTGDGFRNELHEYNNYFSLVPDGGSPDFNGDGRSDISNISYTSYPFDLLYIKKEGKELLLEKIKNGVDHTTQFTYKRLTEAGSFYTRGALTAHPLNNIQLPLNAVSVMAVQNGIGSNSQVLYNYEEAKIHKEGKGFLGFKKVTANNLTMGFKTIAEQELYPIFYAVAPYKTSTYLSSNNSLISQTTLDNQFQAQDNNFYEKRYWIKTNSVYENKVLEGRSTFSSMTYDTYGNVTQSTVNNNNVVTTTTTATYGAHNTPVPAKPNSVLVTTTRTGQAAYTKSTSFLYNGQGQVSSKIEYVGSSPQTYISTTSYTYNNFGNQTGMTLSPSGMTARSSSAAYDGKGRFALTMTNALGQTASATYDTKWGKPLSETGIDGLTTSYQYDAFGRLTTSTHPEGFSVTTAYGWDINAGEGTVHYALTTHPGKPDTKVWYDALDREKKTQTEGFQGQWITAKKTYDARGNAATVTPPYKSGETVLTTTNTYDAYNRFSSAANTLGSSTYSYAYSSGNLTTTVTNPAGQVSSKVTDAAGALISATDYGGTLTYTYNSQGNVTEVKQGSTVLAASQYDQLGRQTYLTDLNAGTSSYVYDILGQLTQQTLPDDRVTDMTYDLLGRMTNRYGSSGGSTSYQYFPSGSGASTNKIKKIIGFAGEVQEFTYNAYGRVSTDQMTVDGIPHTTSFAYNIYSDVLSITYPSGFAVNSVYDANGYLNTLKNGTNAVTMFTNTGMNGFNQYTGYTLGNSKTSANTYYYGMLTRLYTAGVQDLNLTWNYQSGNLSSRNDAVKGKTESFTYDNLNRLLSCTGAGLPTGNMAYAANGNLSTKTDAGTYAYDYDKIHATNHITNPGGSESSATQNISYNHFDQPSSISEGSYQLNLTYAADYERIKTVLLQNGSTINTRYYFGSYEKDISSGSTRHLHYINAGEGLVAMVVRENGTDTYNYVYTDHLGSILTVTNSAGTVVAEQNFDAWGRKRNTTTWGYSGVPSVPSWLYRGYTGHEHLPQFGLINMNGRLYDPVVGRMLSPDNHVIDGGMTQAYNRYAYALNNPLKYTDPDGEHPILIGIAIGAAIGAATSAATYSAATLVTGESWTWKGFGRATLMGTISGGISGGIGAAFAGSAFGQSLAFGVLNNSASNLATQAAFGNDITIGSFVGSIASGFIAGSWPGFSGVEGGALGNIMAEMLYNSGVGAFAGGVGGAIGSVIDGNDVGVGFASGLSAGALGGAVKTGLNILAMGPTYKPEGIYGHYDRYAPVFRTGTPLTRLTKPGSGITIGRNLVTNQYRNNKEFLEYQKYYPTVIRNYVDANHQLRAHEYYHYIQQIDMGYANFYGATINQYMQNGFGKSYSTPGTLENAADAYSYGIFLSIFRR